MQKLAPAHTAEGFEGCPQPGEWVEVQRAGSRWRMSWTECEASAGPAVSPGP